MPVIISGATSGSTTVQATDAVTATITLPSATGTVQLANSALNGTLGATTPSTVVATTITASGLITQNATGYLTANGAGVTGFKAISSGSDAILRLTNTTATTGKDWYLSSGNTGNLIVVEAALGNVMALIPTGGVQHLNTISVGNATPSTSGAGITFPATQSASTNANTLDDYEEGTWTPGADDAGGNSFTAGVAVGRYVKVGNVVTANCYFTWTSKGSVNAGPMAISGLPFASNNTSNFSQAAVIGLASGFDTVVGTVQLAANNLANSTRINLLQITDNAGFNYLPANSCSNTGEISVSISYIV